MKLKSSVQQIIQLCCIDAFSHSFADDENWSKIEDGVSITISGKLNRRQI